MSDIYIGNQEIFFLDEILSKPLHKGRPQPKGKQRKKRGAPENGTNKPIVIKETQAKIPKIAEEEIQMDKILIIEPMDLHLPSKRLPVKLKELVSNIWKI